MSVVTFDPNKWANVRQCRDHCVAIVDQGPQVIRMMRSGDSRMDP